MGRCECPDRSYPLHHGGQDECPREAADHSPVVASPALCLHCFYGCRVLPRCTGLTITLHNDDDKD